VGANRRQSDIGISKHELMHQYRHCLARVEKAICLKCVEIEVCEWDG
jgi:hypothetical protein